MAVIRRANEGDAAAIAAIYGPYCESTVISFEEVAPTADEMARRVRTMGATRPWIVLEEGEAMVGYAYASAHHERAAYRWSASTAIYIDRRYHRRGAGRALYTTLFTLLSELGYFTATAGITLPNVGSIGLHESFGFKSVGVYRRIGFKMGSWHDVGWYQLMLRPDQPLPRDPRVIDEIVGTPAWEKAVAGGLAHYKASR